LVCPNKWKAARPPSDQIRRCLDCHIPLTIRPPLPPQTIWFRFASLRSISPTPTPHPPTPRRRLRIYRCYMSCSSQFRVSRGTGGNQVGSGRVSVRWWCGFCFFKVVSRVLERVNRSRHEQCSAVACGEKTGTDLDEANVGGLLTEALTADVEAILADQTGGMGADAAVVREKEKKSQHFFLSFLPLNSHDNDDPGFPFPFLSSPLLP
jgi:hypothetical protein